MAKKLLCGKCRKRPKKDCAACDVLKSRVDDPLRWILARVRMNAKKKNNICTLKSKYDLPKIPEYCPVFPWLKLRYAVGEGRRPESLSIDRIDNTRGYVPGNLMFMSWRANRLKHNATLQELEAFGKFAKKVLKKLKSSK